MNQIPKDDLVYYEFLLKIIRMEYEVDYRMPFTAYSRRDYFTNPLGHKRTVSQHLKDIASFVAGDYLLGLSQIPGDYRYLVSFRESFSYSQICHYKKLIHFFNFYLKANKRSSIDDLAYLEYSCSIYPEDFEKGVEASLYNALKQNRYHPLLYPVIIGLITGVKPSPSNSESDALAEFAFFGYNSLLKKAPFPDGIDANGFYKYLSEIVFPSKALEIANILDKYSKKKNTSSSDKKNLKTYSSLINTYYFKSRNEQTNFFSEVMKCLNSGITNPPPFFGEIVR